MIRRIFFLLLVTFFVLISSNRLIAQSNVAILLNEYSASNIGTPVDNYGVQSDWVELYNAHTNSVNLSGYWLSNDRFNLYKWRLPNSFILGVNQYATIWLSGKNTTANGSYHANFTLDQCKNQWLILSTSQGVIRDSIFIQKTKGGHTRGRIDKTTSGVAAWKLYTNHSFLQINPTVNNYIDYAPKPEMISVPLASPVSSSNVNAGGFYPTNSTIVYFKLKGFTYDTAFAQCFDIFYTKDGSYPIPGYPAVGSTTQYYDSITGSADLTFANSSMVRAIAVANPTRTCYPNYLPSFCETNTYFVDNEYNNFSSNFGVVSLAMDTSWFMSNGVYTPTIHVEYYDSKKQMSEGYAIASRPPQEEWRTQQRGLNITIDDRYGFGCGFEGKVFNVEGLGKSDRASFPTLHLKAGDIDSHSAVSNGSNTALSDGTGLRDVFYQSLAIKYKLNVNPLHVKPVITFVNGKYWGVYDLREVYDKHYEAYYNGQSKDSLDMNFYHNTDGSLSYADGSASSFNNNFKTDVYTVITTKPMTLKTEYDKVMTKLDKSSFIDYSILNSFAMNTDLWNYNIAYAKGGQLDKKGSKWHYYLWNTPTIFNTISVATNTLSNNNCNLSPCSFITNYLVSPLTGNGHGIMLKYLMNTSSGGNPLANGAFQLEYKNRYQDLLNGPLKCKTILTHFDYVKDLYSKEMKYHEDPASTPSLGKFSTTADLWDSNTVKLRRAIDCRCNFVKNSFNTSGCFGLTGPFDISVDVRPLGAGSVKLNTYFLDEYPWTGSYYQTIMSFKAVPTNTTFIFDHWELKQSPLNMRPLSLDSIAINFSMADNVVAVFTDKAADITNGESANLPNAFTPNGDGNNDIFKPLGSGKFTSNYEMTIWSRWGQEVFRSVSPDVGWDGNFNGQEAITGVYAYFIVYTNIYGESKSLKGNVTLTR